MPTRTTIYRYDERQPDFDEIKEILGGAHITKIERPECVIWCDEDGLPKQLQINPAATSIARHSVVGDVVVLVTISDPGTGIPN